MLELAVGGIILISYQHPGTLTVIQIRRNSTQHNGVVEVDNMWTFGQSFSVVILCANIKEVLHFLIGFCPSSRRPERSHECQAELEAQHASNEIDSPPVSDVPYSRPRSLSAAHL